MLPASQRRALLRLRHEPGDRDGYEGRVPADLTVGSIAARTRRRPRPPGPRCSRRSPAGSIAARTGPSSSHGSPCRAPAVQRRAPLPQDADRAPAAAGAVLPPIKGGLHCGLFSRSMMIVMRHAGTPAIRRRAPLRPVQGEGRRAPVRAPPPFSGGLYCGVIVFQEKTPPYLPLPPSGGRLHCGAHTLIVSPVGPFECSRRSTNGELHCGAKAYGVISGNADAPAVRRRAPLRPILQRAWQRRCSVLPPVNGGLHCGSGVTFSCHPQMASFPPVRGGLHCGGRMFPKLAPFRPGAPVLQRRAPLRQVILVRCPHLHGQCSHCPTAGSIAVTTS